MAVSVRATEQEIKNVYRKLAFRYHPDRNPGADAADRMAMINEAYAVLSNSAKREAYDRLRKHYGKAARRQFREHYSDRDIFRETDIRQVFEDIAASFGFRGFDEVIRDMDPKRTHMFQIHRPGLFIAGFFLFGRFGTGGSRSSGGGLGAPPVNGLLSGLTRKLIGYGGRSKKGRDLTDTIFISENSARNGGPYAYRNPKTGQKVVIRIPPGLRHRQRLRLKGMGRPGRGDAPPGDLYIKVSVRRSLAGRLKKMLRG